MSELEKQQRDQYKLKRNKRILVQKIILIVCSIAFLFSLIAYIKLDKDTYVYYTEEGNAIHKAYLSGNEFYEETYLNGSHAYVSSLVEKMTADFSYRLAFDTKEVEFKYNYRIDAQLEILDVSSNAPLYNPTYEILPLVTKSSVGNTLLIEELVEIDYQKYDELAKTYLTNFELRDTSSTLIVRMYVNVVGESEVFATDRSGEYVTELRIPLTKTVFKPQVTSTIPAGEQKILAISENFRFIFGNSALAFGILDALAIGFFVYYIISTRDKHVDYRIRVDRVIRNYRSYIQQITNEFDMDGYQILNLKTIKELLDIHDTIQKPIMSYENDDQTCTQFFIVDDLHIIYLCEIKVDEDDDLKYDFADLVEEANKKSASEQKSDERVHM